MAQQAKDDPELTPEARQAATNLAQSAQNTLTLEEKQAKEVGATPPEALASQKSTPTI